MNDCIIGMYWARLDGSECTNEFTRESVAHDWTLVIDHKSYEEPDYHPIAINFSLSFISV